MPLYYTCRTQQRLKERTTELEAEREARATLAASAAARAIDRDDGDLELADLDAKLSARHSQVIGTGGEGGEGGVSLWTGSCATATHHIAGCSSPELGKGASGRPSAKGVDQKQKSRPGSRPLNPEPEPEPEPEPNSNPEPESSLSLSLTLTKGRPGSRGGSNGGASPLEVEIDGGAKGGGRPCCTVS